MAFVYDPDDRFEHNVNPESVLWQRIETDYWETALKRLVQEHVEQTQSRFAERLLINWEQEIGRFWQVVPKEMVSRLPQPLGYSGREKGVNMSAFTSMGIDALAIA